MLDTDLTAGDWREVVRAYKQKVEDESGKAFPQDAHAQLWGAVGAVFSFGTNDLTQTALGISRDDASSFLGPYTAKGILPADPFMTLDQEGVG